MINNTIALYDLNLLMLLIHMYKKPLKLVLSILSVFIFTTETFAQTPSSQSSLHADQLSKSIYKFLDKQSAKIGVSCHFVPYQDSATISQTIEVSSDHQAWFKQTNVFNYRGQDSFVIMSVAKLPIAIYAMHMVNSKQLRLDTLLFIDSNDIKRDTHSPTVNGHTQPFSITLQQAIEASILLSDNITTDLIIDAVGGVKNIEAFFKQLGYKDLHVRSNYRNMHPNQLGANCSSPNEMNQLLLAFYFNYNKQGANPDFIYQLMKSTPTGPNRIRGELPSKTIVAHKTGTYFTDTKHVAINDVGIIRTQKGILFLSVFVNDFKMSSKQADDIIAEISKMLFDHYN